MRNLGFLSITGLGGNSIMTLQYIKVYSVGLQSESIMCTWLDLLVYTQFSTFALEKA